MTTRSKKAALLAIKYMPIIGALVMIVHSGFLLIGIDLNLADNVATMQALPAFTLLLVSHAFGFCWVHKAFTIYDLLVSLCIDYNRDIGFTYALVEHRLFAFTTGIILFTILFIHRRAYNRMTCRYDKDIIE